MINDGCPVYCTHASDVILSCNYGKFGKQGIYYMYIFDSCIGILTVYKVSGVNFGANFPHTKL